MSDSIIYVRRKGTQDDPYISITQDLIVKDGKVQLQEIPDDFTHVLVTNPNAPEETYYEIYSGTPNAFQYLVDYNTFGFVLFNNEDNNKELRFQYKGTGVFYLPAGRVWTKESGGDVIETLQDIIDTEAEAIGHLEELNTLVTNAETATNNANIATANINDAISNANNATINANNAADNASNKAELANTATINANNATTLANDAADLANDKADLANTAAINANNAADLANDAADLANTKAGLADLAATNAQEVADNYVNKGEYNSGTQYYEGNEVYNSGSSYRAKQNTIGNAPPVYPTVENTYWIMTAKKGSDGAGGDMFRTTYDTNMDGKVNSADVADSVPWSGITSKPSTFTPSAHEHNADEINIIDAGSIITATNVEDALQESFNQFGILSNLTTTEKSNLVGAVSEVKNEVKTHLAENVYIGLPNGVDDTTAVQNALNQGAQEGKKVVAASGVYKVNQITIPSGNLEFEGAGRNATFFMPLTSDQTLFYKEQEVVGGDVDVIANQRKIFRNMAFADENGLGGCRAFYNQDLIGFKIENVLFRKLAIAVQFNRGKNISIDNVWWYKGGRFIFDASPNRAIPPDTYDYCGCININNVQDIMGYSDLVNEPWWTFRDCANVLFSNVQSPALMGKGIGISIEGKTEGFWANNVILVWPTVGVRIIERPVETSVGVFTDIAPQYTNLISVSVDQPSSTAFIVQGQYTNMESCIAANGDARGVGSGIDIFPETRYFNASKLLVRNMASNGIAIQSGAKDIVISDSDIYANASQAGAQISAVLAKPFDAVFRDCRIVGTVSVTGSRIVNGNTSKTIHKNNSSVATTATTGAEDLMSYTIPAGTLKVGQKVRLKAYGTLGANANSKTVRIFFGAPSCGGFTSTSNGVAWEVTVEADLTASSAQEYLRNGIVSGVEPSLTRGTISVSENADITVKVQGQNGVASAGDIVCEGFTVEVIN
jgi:hypothetical protein